MNRFYLLLLNNHISLCLENCHMNSVYISLLNVDAISWVSIRHQMCSIHPWGGGAGSRDQPLPRPQTLVSNLVRWVEARAKLDALYAIFLGRGPLSFILVRWCPQHSQYWLRWKTCSKSLLGIPLISSSFPFMSRPGVGTWLSSIHGTLLFSPHRAQWTLPLSLTLDTRTI